MHERRCVGVVESGLGAFLATTIPFFVSTTLVGRYTGGGGGRNRHGRSRMTTEPHPHNFSGVGFFIIV